MSKQSEYYTKRATAERILSGLTTDPRATAIHLEMAKRYEALAFAYGEVRTQKPALRIVTREQQPKP